MNNFPNLGNKDFLFAVYLLTNHGFHFRQRVSLFYSLVSEVCNDSVLIIHIEHWQLFRHIIKDLMKSFFHNGNFVFLNGVVNYERSMKCL